MKKVFLGLLPLLLTMAPLSWAELAIENAYIRTSIPGAPNTAAFLTLSNSGDQTIRLVRAESEIAARTELHTHTNDNGVMRMREVEAVEVPAGGQVVLQPGGLHVMFMQLVEPLNPGEQAEFYLVDDQGTRHQVQAPVMKIKPMHHKSSKQH